MMTPFLLLPDRTHVARIIVIPAHLWALRVYAAQIALRQVRASHAMRLDGAVRQEYLEEYAAIAAVQTFHKSPPMLCRGDFRFLYNTLCSKTDPFYRYTFLRFQSRNHADSSFRLLRRLRIQTACAAPCRNIYT
jgi:hypothetical protein